MARKWVNLTCIMLNERSQIQKAVYSLITFIWQSGEGKINREERDQSFPEVWGRLGSDFK